MDRVTSQSRIQKKENDGHLKVRIQECQTNPCIQIDNHDALPFMKPKEHHQISNSDKVHENIIRFAHKNLLDPVVKVSILLKLIFIC